MNNFTKGKTVNFLLKTIFFSTLLLSYNQSQSQCGWRGVLNNGTVTAGCNAFGATVQVPSTSYRVLTVVTGVNYSVSTCGGPWDSQLTGFNGTTFQTGTYNDDNGPSCTSTTASFDWTSTYNGSLNIQVERYNCGSVWETTSASLQVRQNTTVSNTTSTAAICLNSTKALTATLGGTHNNPTITWSIVSGGGSIAGTTYTPASAGSKTIRATVGVCTSDVTFTVDALSTLGTLTNGTTREFCNSGGDFGPSGANIGVPTVSGQTGTVVWDWGSNNGTWNTGWVTGASSGTSSFPKQVGTSNGDADRTRYRVTNGVCPAVTSGTILISNYWNEAPTSLTTTDNYFCSNAGGNLTLTATFPTNINMRGTVRFYSGSCGGTLVGTVTPAAGSSTAAVTIAKPTSTTTYYARYEPGSFTGCSNTACEQVIVNVNPIPSITSVTAPANPICVNATQTLTANGVAGAGATVTWWTGTGGTGTNLGTGTTLTAGPGTYYARVTGTCNPAVEASITVGSLAIPAITSVTAPADPICANATQTLTANGVAGAGATVTWWTGTGGTGTNLGTGTTLTAGPGTFYARVTGTCNPAVEASITVGSLAIPAITSVTAPANPICANATQTLTANGVAGAGATVTWWTGTGGTGTNLGTGTTLTAGPGTYYARVTGTCNPAVEASITVGSLAIPAITSVTAPADPICANATQTLTANGVTGAGATVTWWTGTGGTGTNLGTGTTLTAGPGTYYARVTGTCNPAVEASITVGSDPVSVGGTANSNQTLNSCDAPADLTLSGNTGSVIKWQWATNAAFTTPNDIPSSASTTLTSAQMGSLQVARYFRAEVQSGVCPATTSSNAAISIAVPSNIVSSTTSESCVYSGTNGSSEKFLVDGSNNILVGINEGSINLGTVNATVTVAGSVPTFGTTNSPSCPSYTGGEYYLQRSFNITTGATYPLSTPVEVNLYFTQAELNALNSATTGASADYQTCYGTVNTSGTNLMLTIQHSNGSFSTRTQGGGLTVTANTPSTNIYKATFTTDRFSDFRLHGDGGLYSGNGLPVKLTKFTAQAIDNSYIRLDWATALEIDNRGFEIERSEDGINFTNIGWRDGNGNTTEPKFYAFDDKTVSAGITYYYRLKQIDFDGDTEFSNIVSSRINSKDEFTVSDFIPTEVKGSTKLEIFTTNNREVTIAVFNTLGQPILNRKESLTVGNNKIEFSFDDLPAGTYMTSIKSNNEFVSRKFVVIR